MKTQISVIICTRNRAAALRKTLESLKRIRSPYSCETEVLVIDNASTDDTYSAVESAGGKGLNLRYAYESKPGQSNARNKGLALARGGIIVFTDDDVVPGEDWLEKLVSPLLARSCDAVVGHIELAGHLVRDWMTSQHKLWLAAPDARPKSELELIGANMGFHRYVLDRVSAFDPELGPGALGFGDDSLFSWQLCEAGFRLREVTDARVVHHPEASRLLRSSWISATTKRGHTIAYLLHHWHHGSMRNPLAQAWYFAMKLRVRRILQPPVPMDAEGCTPWEISYLGNIEMCRHYLKERRLPRHYAKRGLARLTFQSQPAQRRLELSSLKGASRS